MDVNTILIDMDVMIPEQVVENPDGTYSIFINSRLNRERQIAAYAHALEHIKKHDFEKSDANQIECDANFKRTMFCVKRGGNK